MQTKLNRTVIGIKFVGENQNSQTRQPKFTETVPSPATIAGTIADGNGQKLTDTKTSPELRGASLAHASAQKLAGNARKTR